MARMGYTASLKLGNQDLLVRSSFRFSSQFESMAWDIDNVMVGVPHGRNRNGLASDTTYFTRISSVVIIIINALLLISTILTAPPILTPLNGLPRLLPAQV